MTNQSHPLPPLMTAPEIKALISSRGWTQAGIAGYWGVSKNWIYLLIKNESGQRSARDDCAFRGLPDRRTTSTN